MPAPFTDPQARAAVDRFRAARRSPDLAVLEGFHALKHALRFGATVIEVATTDPAELDRLARELAPDVATTMRAAARTISPERFAELAPRAPRTGVMAVAERPAVDVAALLEDPAAGPIVLLEDPRNLSNLGACVRVAAGAGAAGVLTTGDQDPWSPDALRGAAGLHYALPVARIDGPPVGRVDGAAPRRPLLAVDPEGEPLDPARVDPRTILAFGTERDGLSAPLLEAADARVRIPMRPGVSSLNLATSVAAVLYVCRFGGEWGKLPG